MTGLRQLYLDRTRITNAGLTHLGRLSQLDSLNLAETKITDDGVKELELVLPKAKVHR